MNQLLRDGDGFEICKGSIENREPSEVRLSKPRTARESQVGYTQWKNFVEGRQVTFETMDDYVLDSWYRCREMAVDPSPRRCWDFRPMSELEPFASTLLKICGDVEHTAYEAIRGKGLLITMTNSDARVARTCGDVDVLRQADRLNFGPGASWAEQSVGTNAIGTALTTGRPMQVFGEEHFCRSHHSWSCTAAPIFDPRGNIWGCFDISGPVSSDHSQNLELVIQAARALEQRLCRLYCSELEGQLGSFFSSSMFNSVTSGILFLDSAGRITSANNVAEILLECPRDSLRGRRADEFFDYQSFLAKVKIAPVGEPMLMQCLSKPNLYVRAMSVFSPTTSRFDTIISINETQASPQFAVAKEIEKHPDTQTPPPGFEHVLQQSRAMQKAITKAASAARTPSTVLLYGESGTGKELFARGIHLAGPRADNPFVAVNCGAFSEELVQSELFGYRGGAFTGAMKRGREGKFQKADTGVLFLDEVSEMPLSQQVNLLRTLEDRTVVPVGGTSPQPVDVKIVAATNKDLSELVRQGRFREDLYYRLNVVGIELPPLRDRGNDIALLADYHLKRLCRAFDIPCSGLTNEALDALLAYDWPGNVRELVNCLEYAVNTISGDWLDKEHLPTYLLDKIGASGPGGRPCADSGFQLKKLEADAIRNALEFHQGNISKTAKALGIGRNTLYSKMDRYRIQA